MRSYPRMVYLTKEKYLIVKNEEEEVRAAELGYESAYDPKIIEKRKGTDREILREFTPKEPEPEVYEIKSIQYYSLLPWPKLKSEAKVLEGVFKQDIVTRTSTRATIIKRIERLLNGSNG